MATMYERTVDVGIATEDAIPIHFESAHQVRIALHIHSVLGDRQNVIPIHRRSDVILRGQDDVVRAAELGRKRKKEGIRIELAASGRNGE